MRTFDLAQTADVMLASRRAFSIAAREAARQFYRLVDPPAGDGFRAVLTDLDNGGIPDSPRLRHWAGATRSLVLALERRADPDPSSVSHLFVDALDGRRIYDLHSLRLVEAWVAHALAERRPFSLSTGVAAPRRLVVGHLGTVKLDEDAEVPAVIESDGALLRVDIGTSGVVVDREGAATLRGAARFLRGLRVVHPSGAVEVPIHDPGLSEPYHANAAIVRSARAVREWQATLSRGLDLLAEFEPAVASEVMELCQAVLPLHNGGISFGSASPEELVGLVYLPGVARVDDVAECLLHEAMHQKLYRIESCAELFLRDSPSGEVYYSPWRTDPRPLRMLLHGAYVFAGVAELWQKVWSTGGRHEDHAERTLLRSRQCAQALEILERHASLTPLGLRVLRGVRAALEAIEGAVEVDGATRAEINSRLAAHAERHAAYVC